MAWFVNYFKDDEVQSERKPNTFFEGYQLQIFESDDRSESLAYITLFSYTTMDDYEVSVYYGNGERLRRYTISDYKEARSLFLSLRDALIHALRNEYLIMSNRKASNVL
jgi:hypothetical protein